MSSTFFTFDYDYAKECWNLPRGSVPSQLKAQGVPHALWMHFWDYAQSVVERASVRSIMKDKLHAECHNFHLSYPHTRHTSSLYLSSKQRQIQEREREMQKLEEQTSRDFECLQREAERLFPNSKANISRDGAQKGRPFGLAIRLLHSNSSSPSSSTKDAKPNAKSSTAATTTPLTQNTTLHLQYDARRATWNLPREQLPSELAKQGVKLADWIAIWEYGFGVNQRAHEREHLNELHDRELRLCQKSLTYMQSNSSSQENNNTTNTTTHIGLKMDKLRRAKEANANNTQTGWHELQRRATQRFEPYGVKVSLSRPAGDSQIGCGLEFQCPNNTHKSTTTTSSSSGSSPKTSSQGGRQSPPCQQPTKKMPTASSSIWLHHHKHIKEDTSPTIPSVWNCGGKEQSKKIRTSSHQPAILTASPNHGSGNVLRSRENTKENAPPKPETVRHYHHKSTSSSKDKNDTAWGHGKPPPVVLTYVHDEVPTKIEVTTPLSFEDPIDSFDEEDSHGYVVPPAPSDPPSSIGSSSSSSLGSSYPKATAVVQKKKKVIKRVRFGHNQLREFENPYNKSDKEHLWFSHKERDANRAKTKLLAQRVMDSRDNGGSTHNVVFMDSDTEEEVCWRGLEHAQKGNLSSRQETRRAFMAKVLEKQRSLRLDAFTFRRGTPSSDPMGVLQQFASRQSRSCRERAQKFAANDAKEARAVYKESLRKANLYSDSSVSASSSSTCGSQYSRLHSQQYREPADSHHKNDIFQDYCRQMHLASKVRVQQAVV